MKKQKSALTAAKVALPIAMFVGTGLHAGAVSVPGEMTTVSVSAQQPTNTFLIKGVVNDQNGDPLTGVTVRLADTEQGTTTDLDGKFSIKAGKGARLLFSYIGFQPQEVTIDSNAPLNITMSEDSEVLDEIIVWATERRRKSRPPPRCQA